MAEALDPGFAQYAQQVVRNARALAETLAARGLRIVTGGTDTHLVLVDVGSKGILGRQAETVLEAANITANKNPIPGDRPRPPDWVGLRLGTGAVTTRGLREAEVAQLGSVIADLIDAEARGQAETAIPYAREVVSALCSAFPAG
jgi:glycine hydroxymethyltransferase